MVGRGVGERHTDELGLGPSIRWPGIHPPPPRHWPYRPRGRSGSAPHDGDAGDQDPVPDLDVLDAGADLLDGAYRLVTEDPPVSDGRHVALEDVEIGSADRDASTRTTASVSAWIAGSGTSSQAFLPGPW